MPSSDVSDTSPASKALSDPKIVNEVLAYLDEDLLVLGRERRQALFAGLASVSKAWLDPVNKRLYRYHR